MRREALINVFLSSTFLDLQEHRRHIREAMGRIPWVNVRCMEYEAPNNDACLQHCLGMVNQCQVYVGLVGSRYGSTVENGSSALSFTEREFDHAAKLKLYKILLQSRDAGKGSVDDATSLARFLKKIRQHYIGHFDEKDEKSASQPVAEGLSGIWDQLDGEMLIGVNRSYDIYLRKPEELVALRTWVAHDAGLRKDEVPKVWLVSYSAPTPHLTLFRCWLPRYAQERYLRETGRRRGGVEWFFPIQPGDPRFPFIPEVLTRLASVLLKANQYAGVGMILETIAAEGGLCPVHATLAPSSPSATDFYMCDDPGTVRDLSSSTTRTSEGVTDMNEQEEPQEVSPSPPTPERTGSRLSIPMIAFFGTKGGVGKTTIMDRCAMLIARAPSLPNVLLVDFDVHHRGLTVLRTSDEFGACKTIHEYLADQDLAFSGARDVTPLGDATVSGKQYLIPASNLAAKDVYETLGRTRASVLLTRIRDILGNAVRQYAIDVVLIDCGPIVDPLTASAAHLCDRAFIIGQNEPISFQALQNYAIRIREFFPDYDASSVRVVLNKVRGPILQKGSIYAAIPFTMEVVDYSEGLPNIDEVRLTYLDYCVYGILTQTFKDRYPKLTPGPEAVLTENQRKAIDAIEGYPRSRWYARSKARRHVRTAGCIATILGALLMLIAYALPVQHLGDVARDQSIPGTQSTFEPSAPGKKLSPSGTSVVSLLRTYGPWSAGVLMTVGLVLAYAGHRLYWRLYKQATDIVRLKQLTGYEGLLELLTSPDGRQKFTTIQVLSERTEKEVTP